MNRILQCCHSALINNYKSLSAKALIITIYCDKDFFYHYRDYFQVLNFENIKLTQTTNQIAMNIALIVMIFYQYKYFLQNKYKTLALIKRDKYIFCLYTIDIRSYTFDKRY